MRHVRVILLGEEQLTEGIEPVGGGLDFSRYGVNSFNNVDPVQYQREVRNEWE